LAEELQKNGVYVHVDQWDVKFGMDLLQYMESRIRESDFTLLICTPNFAEKANAGRGELDTKKRSSLVRYFIQARK
jgi:TIR domain